jgi:hypothetical protein
MKTLIRMICLGVLAATLPGPSPARAISAQAFDNAWNLCRLETTRTERRMAIPRHLLTAISLAESGRRDDANGVNVAWPWTVTSGGQGRFFDTKAEALAEVEILMTQGVRNIDVGCMQVNLFYHASAFETLDEAFDPRANTTYAATYLKTMHAATGDWTDAAGYYHSTTPRRNGPYKEKVLTFWRRQGGDPGGATAVAARTPGTKAKLFIRIDHGRMARLNARFKARRDAQRIGGGDGNGNNPLAAFRARQLDAWRDATGRGLSTAHLVPMRRAELELKEKRQMERLVNGDPKTRFVASGTKQLRDWRIKVTGTGTATALAAGAARASSR